MSTIEPSVNQLSILRSWSLGSKWLKGALAFIALAAGQGIIGGRADAIFVWASPLLSRQVTLPLGVLIALGVCLWLFFIAYVSWRASSTDSPSASAEANYNEESANQQTAPGQVFNELLEELALQNSTRLPTLLGRLRHAFDTAGNAEDANWCAAELNGYSPDSIPEYRTANAEFTWRSPGGISYIDRRTGRQPGQPAERVAPTPLENPLSELVRNSQQDWKTPTGQTINSYEGPWNEIRKIPRAETQGAIRRMNDEAYRRTRDAIRAQ